MDFQDVVMRRRMVRAYDPTRPVPAEIRERLLENALHAPSAGFTQGWAFLVLESPGDRDRFWMATSEDDEESADPWLSGMRTAPLIIVSFSNKSAYLSRYAEPDKGWTDRDESRWPVPYWHIDTGFASLLLLLSAVDAGLGACFFGVPPDRAASLHDAFQVPDTYTAIGVITVGYRAPDRRSPSLRRGRRPVTEVVHRGRWGRHDMDA
jgi:nitroreductase